MSMVTIRVDKEYLSFSAGHFTIFSATERERLHGHNYRIVASVDAEVDENGLCFDYKLLKTCLRAMCEQYHEYTLIAELSPHLKITPDQEFFKIEFDGQNMMLLQSDTLLLPLRNITIEELSQYFLNKLLNDNLFGGDPGISGITVGVSSGPGQTSYSEWRKPQMETI